MIDQDKHALRHRMFWLGTLAALCAAGLMTRRWSGVSPNLFNAYFPDAAWTMAVYCGFGLLFDRGVRLNLPAALGVSYLVEISQLLDWPILAALRGTMLGGLVLGYGFLWSDIICYTVGALVCTVVELLLRRGRKT